VQLDIWIDSETLEGAADVLEGMCARVERFGRITEAWVSHTKMADRFNAFIEIRGRGVATYRKVRAALGSGWKVATGFRDYQPTIDDGACARLSEGSSFAVDGVTTVEISRIDKIYDRARFARADAAERAARRALVPEFITRELASKKLLDDFFAIYVDEEIGKYVAWIATAPNARERARRRAQMVREVESGRLCMGKERSRSLRKLADAPPFVARAILASGAFPAFRRRTRAQRRAYLEWVTSGKTPAVQRRRLSKMLSELANDLFMGAPLPSARTSAHGYRVR
jgi:hypothetical protein